MSIDLSVWSELPPYLPRGLPETDCWEQAPEVPPELVTPDDLFLLAETGERILGDSWYYEKDCWLIEVMACEVESPSNILDDVRAKLPTAKYVTHVTLEPVGAGQDGYQMLERVVRELARAYGGVWVNLSNVASLPDEGLF